MCVDVCVWVSIGCMWACDICPLLCTWDLSSPHAYFYGSEVTKILADFKLEERASETSKWAEVHLEPVEENTGALVEFIKPIESARGQCGTVFEDGCVLIDSDPDESRLFIAARGLSAAAFWT